MSFPGALAGRKERRGVSVFNALDYGATRLGAVNDSAAIELAIIAAVGRGKVYLPEGDYLLTDDLDILDGVELVGAGMGRTVLIVSGNFNGIQGVTKNHIMIRDLTIDCSDQTGGSGIELRQCTDFWVQNVEVLNAFGNGISLGGSGTSDPNQLRGSITDCLIKTPGNHGVSLANGTWWTTVTDNKIFDAVESGVNVSSAHYCTVNGNIAYNTAFSPTPGYAGVRLTNSAEHNAITGNTVYGFERGVFVASTASAGNAVTGNTINHINMQGILVEVSDTAVSGNIIMDCWESGTGAAVEISIAERVTVGVNTITDTRTPKRHTFGVRESNGANNNVIARQSVSGYLNAPYQIIGAGSQGPTGLVDIDGSVPAGNTINTTNVATAFATAVYSIPANTLRVGSVLHFRAAGVYGTAGAGPTLRMRLLGEAVALGDSSAQTCTASLTNRGWELNTRAIVTAIGASGTIECQGVARMNNSTNGAHFWDLETTTAPTFDTTADIDLTLVAIWGTSDLANTITLRQWTVEVLN